MRTQRGRCLPAIAVLAGGIPAMMFPRASEAADMAATNFSSDVSKAVVSDKFRLVFLAGFEGSGHHYFSKVEDTMFQANPDLSRIENNCELSVYPYYVPSCMGGAVNALVDAESQASEEMKKLRERLAYLPEAGSVCITAHAYSYPSLNGPEKVMQYIDLPRLAESAEAEGIDMRVVYMRRSAEELIIANTVHRSFQNGLGDPSGTSPERRFRKYVRVLFTEIAVLHSFLSELGPGLVVCHDWDYLGDRDQASKVAQFIAPNYQVAGLFESSLVETADRALHATHTSRKGSVLPFEGTDALVSRLQRKLDAFEHLYCGPKQSVPQES